MTNPSAAETPLLQAAEEKQRLASDPAVSAWVSANAGTGKTHVLVQRILRLLLSGADPRSILCLTYTKNAAAEMAARVLAKLGAWAVADRADLEKMLEPLLGRAATAIEITAARCLFARVIDAPGGLAIMTIHGFCERVLRRYSFEANVPPGFTVLTEEEARDTLGEAIAVTCSSSTTGSLSEALGTIVAHAGENEFSRVLDAMLCKRNDLAHLFRVSGGDPVSHCGARLRTILGLAPTDTRDALIRQSASVLNSWTIKEIISALAAGTTADPETMARFEAILLAPDSERKYRALKAALLTKAGEGRKTLLPASVKKRVGPLHEELCQAQTKLLHLDEKLCALKVATATTALLALTAAIFERYESEKRARAKLDFDDLIEKTLNLLSRQEAADWVLHELDARIDHILVDEAQDTSPGQWAIVERLTADFFSGDSARDCIPTLFAVGDEKQSIYGFQGAAPALLGYFGSCYEERVRNAGLAWRSVDLDLSFRTLAPILAAVDAVSQSLPGLQGGRSIRHLAFRRDGQGLFELWEPERGEKEEKAAVWEPEEEIAKKPKPSEALAERIAEQIQHWLRGDIGLQEGRIDPGDILILLRKRDPMAGLLQAALKRQGIPVAGADRMTLLNEIAIMDLLALADVITQPDDDLALAAVLKSPLFDFSEEDLFEIAFARQGSLWQALRGAAGKENSKCALASRRLMAWRELANTCSPFDFFAQILDGELMRRAFAKRLGSESFDALDEFLNLAESYDSSGLGRLPEFVSFIRKSASEVKRETDQAAGEVRIMTVHGAKGLESKIVILADTCSSRSAPSAPIYFIQDETGGPPLPVWGIKGAGALAPIAAAKDEVRAADRSELDRLLYVAMTRARDRLYVAGFHNGSLPEACWYNTIKSALSPSLSEAAGHKGRPVWRTISGGGSVASRPTEAPPLPIAVPSYFYMPAPKEAEVSILAPSSLLPWSKDGAFVNSPLTRATAQALGMLVHRLLEVLPALPPRRQTDAAKILASAFSAQLSSSLIAEAIDSVMTILSQKELTRGWDRGLAEAGIGLRIVDKDGKLKAMLLGQADRILLGPSQITVLDYKSGNSADDEEINGSHIAQLSSYRLALRRLYPGANVNAALLNTGSRTLMRAPEAEDDAMLDKISVQRRA